MMDFPSPIFLFVCMDWRFPSFVSGKFWFLFFLLFFFFFSIYILSFHVLINRGLFVYHVFQIVLLGNLRESFWA